MGFLKKIVQAAYVSCYRRYGCEQLTQSRYTVVPWPGVEPATSRVQVQRPTHCVTTPSCITWCLHFATGMNTAGCTTGWVNYANEPSQAALERSNQDAFDVIRLTRSKAAVWTAFDRIKKKNFYLFSL